MNKLPLILGVWCLAATSGVAQLLEPPMKRHLPDDRLAFPVLLNQGLRVADLDGDGDLDVIGLSVGFGLFYENIGELQFKDRTYHGPGDLTPGVRRDGDTAVGDLDGDGDLDMIFSGSDHYLARNGGFLFQALAHYEELPRAAGVTLAAALGDLDADGDLDLVLGKTDGAQNRLLLNDGIGSFSDATAGRLPVDADSTASVALGDLDGDGDLDLVFGNGGSGAAERDRLYLNDGQGTFTDESVAMLPDVTAQTEQLELGDVDADGDLDLVLGVDGQNRLYMNDGFGRLLDGTDLRMPVDGDATRDIALADVDGDGDLDLIAANDGPNRVYLNDGIGGFSSRESSRIGDDDARQVAAGDLDGDGDPDLVIGIGDLDSGARGNIYVNDGSGGFQLITPRPFPRRPLLTQAVAMADVDGDEDLDVVVGNRGNMSRSAQNLVYVNDGTGVFEDETATRMPVDAADTRAVAVGDMDGDGDQDLMFGNSGTSPQNRLYLNDGAGRFVDGTVRLPGDGDETVAVAVGDLDGDGDLDLITGNTGPAGAQNRLYLNGTGGFIDATARLPASQDLTTAVLLVDLDGDTDLDVVVGNDGQSRLYINLGDGSFVDRTAVAMPQLELDTWDLVAIDGEGDGDLDLVLANLGVGNKLFENDGAASFSDVSAARLMPHFSPTTVAVAVGDLDLDGDPDLLFGHSQSTSRSITAGINDGNGVFSIRSAGRNLYERPLALGDVDGDGDLDAVTDAPALRINQHLQLSTPFFPRSPGTFTLEFRARRIDSGASGFTAIAALSLRLASEPLRLGSLGTLHLDPTNMFLLPEVTLTGSFSFVGSAQVQIPPSPALLGRTVYAQALIINDSDPLDARLTGYTADLILR